MWVTGFVLYDEMDAYPSVPTTTSPLRVTETLKIEKALNKPTVIENECSKRLPKLHSEQSQAIVQNIRNSHQAHSTILNYKLDKQF